MSAKLWLSKEQTLGKNGKVLLARFTDSTMVQDIDPKQKDSFVKEFWRAKTYTKDADKLKPFPERDFCEPYMVAQHYCGGTWNDYNQPFIVQIGGCNLRCKWCFVPPRLRDPIISRDQQLHPISIDNHAYFTSEQIIQLFFANSKTHNIFRISGGEPFLVPEFLIDLGEKWARMNSNDIGESRYAHYLWIDTNLLGRDYHQVVASLSRTGMPFGICGCFKGFDHETFVMNQEDQNIYPKLFDEQFQNARQILTSLKGKGELFFYVPEIVYAQPSWQNYSVEVARCVRAFAGLLSTKVHPYAPLRTTILRIKEYESNKGSIPTDRIPTGLTKTEWNNFITNNYPLDLRWLPQYQVPMENQEV